MTQEQKTTFAQAAAIALEMAKGEMQDAEFRQYLTHFNAFYLAMTLGAAELDSKFTQYIMDALITPLVMCQRDQLGIEQARDKELHERAHLDFIAAFKASAQIVLPQDAQYVIERAAAEGFDVPTASELAAVSKDGDVDWSAVLGAERFHFQKACSDIKKGELETKYRKPNETRTH